MDIVVVTGDATITGINIKDKLVFTGDATITSISINDTEVLLVMHPLQV